MPDGRNVYTPPQNASGRSSGHGGQHRRSSRHNQYTPDDGHRVQRDRPSGRERPSPSVHAPPVESSTRTLTDDSRLLAPSQRIKHYASLFLAEKPLEAHREFQRRQRTGSIRGRGGAEGDAQGVDIMDTMGADRPLGTDAGMLGPQGGRQSAAARRQSDAGGTQSPFSHDELSPRPARETRRDRPSARSGGAGAGGQSGAGEDADEDPDGAAADPAYEAFRKGFKQGFLYRVVKAEIVKNKRRRGRAAYLATLKTVYSSIVPSGGRQEPQHLAAGTKLKAYSYIAAMVTFDRVTPTLLGLNASLIVLFITTCMVMTTLFAAGQRRVWLEAINAAADQTLPPVPEGDKPYGPARFWKLYVRDNQKIGGDIYLTEWGGVGAVIVKATKESWRYIAAVFVHDSVWHLLLIGGCAAVAGVLVERRYGIFRTLTMTAMLCVTSSMAAVLFNDACSVSYGSSPLAWGFLFWWMVDTAARVTLWPLRDTARLWKMVSAYKNLSNLLLLFSTTLTLLISDIVLGSSSAAPSITAAISALLITPVMTPRWSSSILEASTVPLAAVGVLVFWVIIPLAGAGTASGTTDEEVSSCSLVQLVPVD